MTDEEAGRVRDFVGYGRNPPDPKWPGGAHVAVNFSSSTTRKAAKSRCPTGRPPPRQA